MQALLESQYFVLLMFPTVLLFIFCGFPVAFALMATAFFFGWLSFGDSIGALLIGRVWDVANNYVLAAVPFFVFMGSMLAASGIAKQLYQCMIQWTKSLRGGLAVGTVIMCTIFAAATGIIGASEIVIGLLAIPPMLAHKYDKGLICGTICAGGSLGAIIPPSVVIVIYGPVAGLSVGKLLLAAVLPGLLLSLIYIIYILGRCYLRPQDGPGLPKGEMSMPVQALLWLTLTSMLPPLALIFAVMGTILLGLAAPTEAAALGAFGALILSAAYRKLSWKTFFDTCLTTLRISCMCLLLFTGGTMYTGVFLGMDGGGVTEQLLQSMNLTPGMTIFLFLTVAFVMGFLLDCISVLLIFVPIFTPLVIKMGFDPIWFSILFLIVIQTSFLTPPMAPAVFYLKGIVPPEIKIGHMFRGVIPYVILQLLGITIIVMFPKLALWLPKVIIGFR